ncbi:MAG: SsrA-binding protein [Maribacter sp.]|uniref:SsrA-binding protein n=1 Tax=Maribacter sp. TaxID=1897614 RepID=UPI003C7842BF
MGISFFKLIANINKAILPSFTKQGLDLAKASKWQLVLIGWRYYVTTRAIEKNDPK